MRPAPARIPCLGILFCAIPGILLSELSPCHLPIAAFAAFCFAIATFRGRRFLPFALLVFTVFFIRHDLDWRRNPGRYPIDLLSQNFPIIHARGIVTTDPVAAGYAFHIPHFRFDIKVTGVAFDGRSVAAAFPAEVVWTGPPPAWGDEVEFTASISPIALPRNPGEFNLSSYLARTGIFAQLSCDYAEDERIPAHGKGDPLIAWSRSCRAFLQRRLTAGIADDPEIAGLVQTITLGLKQETSVNDRELFQHVGALHLFVVNGLHIALLAGILGFLLKPFRIYRRAFALVIIPVLFSYALVTGMSPGSVRAAIMAAVIFGASFAERKPFSFNTLAAAALVLLAWDTNEFFQTGPQFSFAVVAAIILFADFIQRFILPLGVPDPFLPRPLWTGLQRARELCWRRVSELAGISFAASVGSFPFSAGYFNLVAPSGFLANLFLVPIAFGILAEGLFSILTSFANSVALLFNNVNWLLASCMLGLVHLFALLPGGHFFVSTAPFLPDCRITVLDLNPGQAIVIQSHGAAWLVDCGNAYSYFHTVRPFLQSRGVNRLDGLIVTHGAAPSIGAAENVIADFAPREIIEAHTTDRSPVRRALEHSGHAMTVVEAGSQLRFSSTVNCTVMFPPAGFKAGPASDKSLVLRVEDGPHSVLLMSDSAFTGEHWLMDHYRDLHASVVVIGGQSADLAGTDEFIGAVHPYAAIRGAPAYTAPEGQDSRWAAGLIRHGVIPFLQSGDGAVTIDLARSGATLTGFMNNQRVGPVSRP